jgi:Flp pilus assembly protein TadB
MLRSSVMAALLDIIVMPARAGIHKHRCLDR